MSATSAIQRSIARRLSASNNAVMAKKALLRGPLLPCSSSSATFSARAASSISSTSCLSLSHQEQAAAITPRYGPLQRRTMVMVTKSSASDPKPAAVNTATNTTTPTDVPTDINDDNLNPAELSVEITPSCAKQVQNLLAKKNKSPQEMFLRVFVDPGGCSGFQYQFELDDELIEEEDFVFEPPDGDGVRVVVDEASLKLIHGSRIDYVQEMIKSAFVVAENPQSESACGCGSSFAIKNFSANPALD